MTEKCNNNVHVAWRGVSKLNSTKSRIGSGLCRNFVAKAYKILKTSHVARKVLKIKVLAASFVFYNGKHEEDVWWITVRKVGGKIITK